MPLPVTCSGRCAGCGTPCWTPAPSAFSVVFVSQLPLPFLLAVDQVLQGARARAGGGGSEMQ